jgi:hypothetical protein
MGLGPFLFGPWEGLLVGFIVHVSWLFLGMRGGRGEDWQLEYLCREEGLRDWKSGSFMELGRKGSSGWRKRRQVRLFRDRGGGNCGVVLGFGEGIKIREIYWELGI